MPGVCVPRAHVNLDLLMSAKDDSSLCESFDYCFSQLEDNLALGEPGPLLLQ